MIYSLKVFYFLLYQSRYFLFVSEFIYFQKNWVGVCHTLPETLTLFQT